MSVGIILTDGAVTRAANSCSSYPLLTLRLHLREFPCLPTYVALAFGRLSLHRFTTCNSTFLAPFPRHGFAFRAFRNLHCFGTMEPLTPVAVAPASGLPVYLAIPSRRSAPNHTMQSCRRFCRHFSASGLFRASPSPSRLAATPRRNRFVILRTNSSLPVALHPASRRRSYLRLHGYGSP